MKVFFETNIYIAEALLGAAAEQMLDVTARLRWRIICSPYVLDESQRVLVDHFGYSRRFGLLTCEHIRRRATIVAPPASRHGVAADPADSPILAAAVAGGADYLVTNDAHLLALNPYEGLRIVTMSAYLQLLADEGHLASI